MTQTENKLMEFAKNTQEASGLSWKQSLEIVMNSHPGLVHQAARENEAAEFEQLSPSERVARLASRYATEERTYSQNDLTALGNFIAKTRRERNLNEAVMGYRCNCDAITIQALEKGDAEAFRRVPLRLIAKALKVDIEKLIALLPDKARVQPTGQNPNASGFPFPIPKSAAKLEAGLTKESILRVARENPEAYDAYERGGRSSEMMDASFEINNRAVEYMKSNPDVDYLEAFKVVSNADPELYQRYDIARIR